MQFPQGGPVVTGRPSIDAAISAGICLASAGIYLASVISHHRKQRPRRTRAKLHTPFPLPKNRAQKALDALRRRA